MEGKRKKFPQFEFQKPRIYLTWQSLSLPLSLRRNCQGIESSHLWKKVYITLLPGYVMNNPEFFTLLSKSKSSRLRCVSDLIETGFDCIHSRLCTFCTETILKQTPSNKLFKTSAAKAEAVNEGLVTSSICSIITIYRIWREFIKQDLTTSCKFNSLLVVKSNQNTFQI